MGQALRSRLESGKDPVKVPYFQHRLGSHQPAWPCILLLSLASCVTLDGSLNAFEPHFLHLQTGLMIMAPV